MKLTDKDLLNISTYNSKTNPLIKYRLIENLRVKPELADAIIREIKEAQNALFDRDILSILRAREEELRHSKLALLNIVEAQKVLNKSWEALVMLYMFADDNLTTPYLSLAEITNNKYFCGGVFKAGTVRRKLVELEQAGFITEIARDMLPVKTTHGSKYDNFRLMFRLNFTKESALLQALVDDRKFVENAIKRRQINSNGQPRKIDKLLWARQTLYSKDEQIFLKHELNEDRNGHASLVFNRQKTLKKKVEFRNRQFELDDNEIYNLCVARLKFIHKENNVDLQNALRLIKHKELNQAKIEILKNKLQGRDTDFYREVNKKVQELLNTHLDPENPIELNLELSPEEMIESLKLHGKTLKQLDEAQEKKRVSELNDLRNNTCLKKSVRKNLNIGE